MKQLKFVWLLVVLLALAACGKQPLPDTFEATPTAAPTITSDKEDYAPGELVTLTGSNWQAGESVHINVDDDQTKRWERNVNVTADENGNITDQFNLPDVFVATYQVVATGEQSGTATTMFTDGNARFLTSGPTISNVAWTRYSTSDCSGGNPARIDSGTANMTSNAGGTLAVAIVDDQSVQLAVPATAGTPTQNFSSWSAKSAGDPFTVSGDGSRTICVPGFLKGNRDYQANYVTAPSVTTTSVGSITALSSTFGGTTNLSATVSPAGAPGSVAFFVNGSTTAAAGTVSYSSSTGVATLSNYTHGLNARTTAYSVRAVFTSSNTSTHTVSEATNNTALTVGKAAGSVSISNIPSSATVGGTFTPTYTKVGDGTASTTSSPTSICTVTSGVVNFVATGTCNLQASVTEGANHLAATGTEQTFTIAAPPKQDQTITFDQPTSPAAFGSTFNVAPTSSANLPVSVAASGSCSISNGTVTMSSGTGTCTLKASQAGNDSYNAAADMTRTVDASRANQTISFATGTPTTKKYGDENFTVSATATSGSDVSFTVKDNSTCSVSSNGTVSNLRVGDCVIVASQGGNGNYNAAPAVEHKIVIGKASAEVNLSNLSHTYDGNAKTVTVTTKPSGLSVTVTYGDSSTAPTNAGSYNVVASVNDANYEASQASNTLVIAQADATIKVEGYEGVYDGEAHGAVGTAKGVKGESLDLNLGEKFTNVPGGKANWSLNGNGNYKAANGSVDIKITQAEATVDVKGYEGTYDGEAHGASGSAKGIEGESLTLNLGSSFTNVPGGTANWSLNGNGNYKAANGSVDIKINKAKATVNVSGYDGTYDGNPHGATGSAKGVKNENLNGLSLGSSFTNVPGGTANWSFGGNGNYEEASGSVEIKIAQANATINVDGYSSTYDGKPHGATGTATGVKGESLSLNLGDSFTDVPGGTANWSFAGDTNYKSANGLVNIVISEANQTISFMGAPSTAVFGSKFTVSATGGASGESVVLGASGACTISGTEVTMTSGSGSCNLTANQAGNNNYNAAAQATQSTTAQKADQTISWSNPAAISYGGALGNDQLNASLTTGAGALTYSPAAGTVLTAGTHTLTVTAAATNNFNLTSKSVSITVNPWAFTGFFSPVEMGKLNSVKAGSAVPVKFNLGGDRGLSIFANNTAPKAVVMSCSAAGVVDPIDSTETVTAGSSSLKYDTLTGQYTYVWKTEKSWTGCRQLQVKFADGQTQTANFQFLK